MVEHNFLTVVGGEVKTGLRCTDCELHCNKYLSCNAMPGRGPDSPSFMFVGHAPGMEDDSLGVPFVGDHGKLLWGMSEPAGLLKSDVYCTNLLKCTTFGEKPKKAWWAACQKHFVKELKRVQPKAIVTFGAHAMNWLTGFSGVMKFRRFGLPCIFDEDILVFPMPQPSMLNHVKDPKEYDKLKAQFVADFKWLKNKMDAGTLHIGEDIPTDYKMAESLQDVKDFLQEFPEGSEVAWDVETADANWKPALFPLEGCRVVALGLSKGPGHARTIPILARGDFELFYWSDSDYEQIVALVKDFFKTHKFYGHNAVQFDAKWMSVIHGIENIDVVFDSMYASHLVYEEPGFHSLEYLAVKYGRMSPWKGSFTVEDITRCCRYLARDVDATARIRQPLHDALNESQKWLHYEYQLHLGKLFRRIEQRGIRIDTDALEDLRVYLEVEIYNREKEIRKLPEVKKFEAETNTTFSTTSTPHIRIIMQDYLKLDCRKRTAKGAFSTDKEVLAHYANIEFCKRLLHYRRATKIYNDFYKNIKKNVDRYGEYIHTNYKVHGTVTGRPSSSDPNLSVTPRADTASAADVPHELVKGVFVASDGRVLLDCDWKQAELRILGIISKCKALHDIYEQGQDAHTATAAKMFNVDLETAAQKEYRSKAKAVNFGLPYGRSAQSIIDAFVAAQKDAALKDGSTFSNQDEYAAREAAEDFILAHQTEFPEVWRWMRKQEAFVKRHRYVETLLGRRRRFQYVDNRAVRQSLNFPIQSLQSDLLLITMVKVDKVLRAMGFDAPIVLTVYDSIVFDVREEDVEAVAKIVKHVMEKLPFDFLTIPMEASIDVGRSLGKQVSLEEWLEARKARNE